MATRPSAHRARWIAAAALAIPVTASCLTWEYVPSVTLGGSYESNPRSVTDDRLRDDAFAAIGAASLDITAGTQLLEFAFEPRAQAGAYTGAFSSSDLNYFDFFLPGAVRWAQERSRYSVAGGFSRVSTRSFPSVDPNQTPSGPQVANPKVDEYQERWNISPSAAWQPGQKDSLSLRFDLDDVSYTESELTGRSDYQGAIGELTWTRSLAQRHAVSLTGTVNAYTSDLINTTIENETISYGAYVGYEYQWSPTTSVGASGGAAHSEISIKGLPFVTTAIGPLPCLDPVTNQFVPCELKTDDENFIGQVFFRQRNADLIDTELSVGRSIQPSSDGAQVTVDSATIFFSKEFTPKLSASLGGAYSRQEAVGASTEGRLGQRFERDYWSISSSVSWRLTRTWSCRAEYSYYQDEPTGGEGDPSQRHRVNIFFEYTGLGNH